MKEYWRYTDSYPGDYANGIIPDGEWALCEFEYGEDVGVPTAIVTKVIATGSNEYIDKGFEMTLFDDAITDDPKDILLFLFEQKFY